MVGLPKRFAKMGFKKGWREFKKSISSSSTRAAKVTTVAKRRFRRARARTSTTRRSRSRGRSSGMMSGWVPLSGREMVVDLAVGATAAKANSMVAPFTDGILEPLGDYKDEARTALIGMALYKFGGGFLKDAGREYFRLAVLSAGAQAGAGLFNPAMTSSSSAVNGIELY